MRKLRMFRLCNRTLTVLLVMSVFGNIIFGQRKDTAARCIQRNNITKQSLSSDHQLFYAIRSGAVGEGVDRAWMLQLRESGIKHVTAPITVQLSAGNLSLSVGKMRFYSSYYFFDQEVFDRGLMPLAKKKPLEESLEAPFLTQAVRFLGDKPGRQLCGVFYLNLLDDACLPLLTEIPTVSTKCE